MDKAFCLGYVNDTRGLATSTGSLAALCGTLSRGLRPRGLGFRPLKKMDSPLSLFLNLNSLLILSRLNG